VGVRSAQRMALHLLERDIDSAQSLSNSLQVALAKVHKCPSCRTLTESTECDICSDSLRDQSTICVVASDSDKSGIEMSAKYLGRYFVLHGVLSPIDGIGPNELGIFELIDFVKENEIDEVILALDEQMESEATIHYLTEHLKTLKVKISRIHFYKMKSGSLDKTEGHVIANAIAEKQEIGFELE
jgi:recombination protein RecR